VEKEQKATSIIVPAAVKPSKIAIPENLDVVFKPNDGPQTEFLSSSEMQTLFGGAAGGGKSVAMVADPMRDFDNPEFRGLLLRRTMPELRELISISNKYYPKLSKGEAKWTERDSTWRFPSGATLWMSYLEAEKDIDKYYGQAYSWIGFDELTHWESPIYWDMLASRLRTSKNSSLKLSMRASTNPGGRGNHWVKKMFIDPAPWGKSFWARDIETNEVLKWPENHSDPNRAGKPLFKRKFVPSKLSDNPYLFEDGRYEANLLSLPEHKRKQLLEGNWDVAEGAAFPEWNRRVHVVEPFHIPNTWTKFRACDYGYSSWSSVLWFAVVPYTEQLVVYRELYVKGMVAADLSRLVKEREQGDRIVYGILDSSLWHKRGDTGPSLAEQMIRAGTQWRPSDRSKGSRIAGKNEIHRRLQLDENNEPGLIIFNSCLNLITHIPSLPLDKNNTEDVDTNYVHDHSYDTLRYGIMSRPKPTAFAFEFGSYQNSSEYKPFDSTFGY